MDKPEIVKAWCESRVGCPYIYGGTGQPCTVAYRQARAAQYPDKAGKIKNNCPRMMGQATTCADCRWCDPETGVGKLAYDCAQLSRAAMAAVGISLVSGANSQWNQTLWEDRGGIAELPRDKVCLVFRDDGGKKGHVGVYTGDGYVIHAKGHDWGVVRQRLDEVNFTHYGIPLGLYDGQPARPILRQGASGQDVEYLQTLLCDVGQGIAVDGKFGPATTQAVKAFQKAQGLTVDGIVGAKTWAALEAATGHDTAPDGDAWDPDAPEIVMPPAAPAPAASPAQDPAAPDDEDIPEDIVILTKEDFTALKAGYAAIAGILRKYDT